MLAWTGVVAVLTGFCMYDEGRARTTWQIYVNQNELNRTCMVYRIAIL